MGAVMSLASMACCCTSAACTLCSCCPGATSSLTTRIGYAILLFLTLGLQIIAMTNYMAEKMVDWKLFVCEPGKPEQLSLPALNAIGEQLIPGYQQFENDKDTAIEQFTNYFSDTKNKLENADDFSSVFTAFLTGDDNANNGIGFSDDSETEILRQVCLNRASSFVVYRITFANFLFFLSMALIMIKVKDSNDPRSGLQNGFWGLKFVAILGISIACLFIKEGTLDGFLFVIGLVAAILFILWQLVLLVDFAHGLNEWLLEKMEDPDYETCGKTTMIILSFGQYLAALVGIILLYVYFGPSGCKLHQFYITIALILGVICGVVATNSDVQDESPSSGILQAAVVSLYCVYMTYTAVASNFDKDYQSCTPYEIKPASEADLVNGSSIFNIVLAVVIVLYSTISSATSGTSSGSTASDIPMLEAGESQDNKVQDDEENSTQYNYSWYHVTMVLASLYMMMILTNWQNPNNQDTMDLADMWPVVWVKVISAWLGVLLYVWTLVAPVLFPDRFSN